MCELPFGGACKRHLGVGGWPAYKGLQGLLLFVHRLHAVQRGCRVCTRGQPQARARARAHVCWAAPAAGCGPGKFTGPAAGARSARPAASGAPAVQLRSEIIMQCLVRPGPPARRPRSGQTAAAQGALPSLLPNRRALPPPPPAGRWEGGPPGRRALGCKDTTHEGRAGRARIIKGLPRPLARGRATRRGARRAVIQIRG